MKDLACVAVPEFSFPIKAKHTTFPSYSLNCTEPLRSSTSHPELTRLSVSKGH